MGNSNSLKQEIVDDEENIMGQIAGLKFLPKEFDRNYFLSYNERLVDDTTVMSQSFKLEIETPSKGIIKKDQSGQLKSANNQTAVSRGKRSSKKKVISRDEVRKLAHDKLSTEVIKNIESRSNSYEKAADKGKNRSSVIFDKDSNQYVYSDQASSIFFEESEPTLNQNVRFKEDPTTELYSISSQESITL